MTPIVETKQLTHLYSAGTPFAHTALQGVDFPEPVRPMIATYSPCRAEKSTAFKAACWKGVPWL